MKLKALAVAISAALLTASAATALADDGGNGEAGKPILKRMSNIQGDTVPGYIDEAEHAFIAQMKFYVPSQAANGTVGDEESTYYYDIDAVLVEERTLAKPLIGVYMYGPFEEVPGNSTACSRPNRRTISRSQAV
ncbi:MAG: hypothetical protein NHG36_03705 [Chromatiaceae bacterium]|nr:hypothetical protein [Candidatus Thioaporhodococcus sediminis]